MDSVLTWSILVIVVLLGLPSQSTNFVQIVLYILKIGLDLRKVVGRRVEDVGVPR